ncbi:MAG: hypothetical protein AAGK05_14470, partial [Pseudomonadota bacterium]
MVTYHEIQIVGGQFLTIKTGENDFIDLTHMKTLIDLNTNFIGPDTTFQSISPVDIVPTSHNIII